MSLILLPCNIITYRPYGDSHVLVTYNHTTELISEKYCSKRTRDNVSRLNGVGHSHIVDSCTLSAYWLFMKEVTDIKTHYSRFKFINIMEVSFMGFTHTCTHHLYKWLTLFVWYCLCYDQFHDCVICWQCMSNAIHRRQKLDKQWGNYWITTHIIPDRVFILSELCC
jgi:hypothetical protein